MIMLQKLQLSTMIQLIIKDSISVSKKKDHLLLFTTLENISSGLTPLPKSNHSVKCYSPILMKLVFRT
ncbi:hypothetical protein C446_11065 [Halobiforma nitratireducens JCM 10879]|uniref:Uncharacterized protein n=1 Tax=Halobiforma nitratireducens JCM 10879 TaxID=1227454 RepID=M0LUJ1_9EURY|nr:hypothetical protein C446_11065 [Halobiforma nitratireducens JCM 10879]